MATELMDKRSQMMLLGCLLVQPNLITETTKYSLTNFDFPERFHKIIYTAIVNLYSQKVRSIDEIAIDTYLSNYGEQYEIFCSNNGVEYIQKIMRIAQTEVNNFEYYYLNIKKYSLLRAYEEAGIDISCVYDSRIVDNTLRDKMMENFENMSLVDITEEIEKRITMIKNKFLINVGGYGQSAGEGIQQLIQSFKETPEYGIPLNGDIFSSIVRGARLKKYYLRSAATGVGKTRLFAADACVCAVGEIFDLQENNWKPLMPKQPTLFVSTELEIEEIQTLFLAFVSGVNEAHILDGIYEDGEEERVIYAGKVIEKASLYIEYLPNFAITDMRNTIKRHVLMNKVRYVFADYIHTSVKMIEELTKISNGMKLREDQLLFMFSNELKSMANELGVFLMSGTQLNRESDSATKVNQNLLRGAVAIADSKESLYKVIYIAKMVNL